MNDILIIRGTCLASKPATSHTTATSTSTTTPFVWSCFVSHTTLIQSGSPRLNIFQQLKRSSRVSGEDPIPCQQQQARQRQLSESLVYKKLEGQRTYSFSNCPEWGGGRYGCRALCVAKP